MKLIRRLGTRVSKKGNLQSWGEFSCPNLTCNKTVERTLSDGLKAKSCGCNWHKPNKNNFKHGETKTRLYLVWKSMKQRILNSKHKQYSDYGGRGITICPEWTESYIEFRDWALNNGYADNLIIDRKNPDGNYEPNNCRFVTKTESNRNKTNTITMKEANEIRSLYKTGKYTQKELGIIYNVNQTTIWQIVNNKAWNQ